MKLKIVSGLIGMLIFTVILSPVVSGIGEDTVRYRAIDDSWVYQCEPDYVKQTGDPNILFVESKVGESPVCAGSGFHSNGRTLVRFGTVELQSTDEITLAEFALLERIGGAGTIRVYEVKRVTTSWTENTVTWNNQPSATNVDKTSRNVNPAISSATLGVTWNVTAIVKSWVNNGTSNIGFQVRDSIEDSLNTNATAFLSKESDLEAGPNCCGGWLNITYISSVNRLVFNGAWLLGFFALLTLGLVGAFEIKRRRGH